eukprot:scaffold179023_cov36-Prasinocladus_malaysianus.AAC.1
MAITFKSWHTMIVEQQRSVERMSHNASQCVRIHTRASSSSIMPTYKPVELSDVASHESPI